MAAGTTTLSGPDRHKLYLQNLQRRKQLERESAAARENFYEKTREGGFQVCFNGANRELGMPAKTPVAQPVSRPRSGDRLLRVAGALPVPYDMHLVDISPDGLPEGPSQQPPRTAWRRNRVADDGPPARRRTRRQWEFGKAVLVRGADGEMFQIDVPYSGLVERQRGFERAVAEQAQQCEEEVAVAAV